MEESYSYLNESLKKVVKGVGFGFTGAIIGRFFGYLTRIVLAISSVLKIFSFAIPFAILAGYFISATIGFQDLRYSVYVSHLSENAVRLFAIVTLLSLSFGLIGAAWGWCIAIMITPFLAFYFLEKRVFPILKTKTKSDPMGKELFSFSWPLLLVGFSGLVLGWADICEPLNTERVKIKSGV